MLNCTRLAATLTTRLVLNLHRLPRVNGTVTSTLPDVAFATNSFLGNIGAPLREETDDCGFADGEENDQEMEQPDNAGSIDKGKERDEA